MTEEFAEGQLVEHTKWGRGMVVVVRSPYVEIHFPSLATDPSGPRRTLQMGTGHVTKSEVQSDPSFAGIKSGAAKAKTPPKPPKVMVNDTDGAIRWFQDEFRGGFADPKFISVELETKRRAHQLFVDRFGNGKGKTLLHNGDHAAIADGLGLLYSSTNIPSPFEKMAMRDGLKDGPAAANLLRALFAFVESPSSETFDGLAGAVAGLPAPGAKSRVLTWPNVTILPYFADPSRFIVLKPDASKTIAARMNLAFPYSTAPTWPTYQAFQHVSDTLFAQLRPLGAKDFIDVQSFMWETRDLD